MANNDHGDHGRRVLDVPTDLGRRAVLEQAVGAGVAGALLAGLGAFGVDLMAAGQAGTQQPAAGSGSLRR